MTSEPTTVSEDETCFYSTKCSCNDHDLTFNVCFEKGWGLTLEMFHDMEVGIYYSDSIWTQWKKRIVTIIKILFCQELQFEGYFIFKGSKHVQDVVDALTLGVKKTLDSERKRTEEKCNAKAQKRGNSSRIC